ncbi:586d3058-78b9-433b-b0f1-b8c67c5ce706 [Thermothielavioides terrestris]|uniref:586d3058-78b9-433b-b0f1-b8c67c5ce706 n=1 Tax=Thermothielavioides terrestris TaxID=2587410 RepID=A0A3S4EYZ7_9PEZI|nr:586d3058-78b9-433b-b0f1-b8c67c5ce706 [Thermothielavioides terrestris]
MLEEVFSIYESWVGDVGRQFFITRLGYNGAGPTTVETGDLVVIPFDGKVPLLLRAGWSRVPFSGRRMLR